MPLRLVAARPDAELLGLPWGTPLAQWPDDVTVALPRGLSRHVVRIVRAGHRILAVKETTAELAMREYATLRDLHRLGLPAVLPQSVVTGRTDADGAALPAALLTEHLRYSLPYRSLFTHGPLARAPGSDNLPALIDALVVLLVRLHLAGFYWGDVSLSNVLFRRDAGGFTAYLVDAETGELRPSLSAAMREHDVTVAVENVFAELLDLQAGRSLEDQVSAHGVVEHLAERYRLLWAELTESEEFGADQMWRVEQRVARLNDLGFDVEELEVITDIGGDTVRIRPRVVELGHHCRELQALTGLHVQDAQARRLLNDLASYTAHLNLGREDRTVVATRWLTRIYEPVTALLPEVARATLEPAEFFHEVLVHRWYLSERAGTEVDIFDAARDYVATVLPGVVRGGTPGTP